MQGYVYRITNPKGKIYIGSTLNIEKRKKQYRTLSCKNQRKIYNSIKKYGWDLHVFDILWNGSIDDMLKIESEYGFKYKTLEKNGLNLRLPKGNEKCSTSEETKLKISLANKGNICSPETRLKLSIAGKGRLTKETTKKLIQEKALIRFSNKEKRMDQTKHLRKKVFQFTIEGEFIKEWPSTREVERILKIASSTISNCCNGKNYVKTAGGFKWSYNKE